MILPTNYQAQTSKSASDLQQRSAQLTDTRKRMKSNQSCGQNLILDYPIYDSAKPTSSTTIKTLDSKRTNTNRTAHFSGSIEIDTDAEDNEEFFADALLMKKKPIGFDKKRFREDLLKSDRDFKKIMNKKKKLKFFKGKSMMSSSRDEDSEEEICRKVSESNKVSSGNEEEADYDD